MKTLLKITLMAFLLSASLLFADVTVGTIDPNAGNCYPFSCNDSGTSVGQSIDYLQVFSSSAFPGTITVTNMEWYIAPNFQGTGLAIGGSYTFYWGYGGVVGALNTNLGANYTSGPNLIGTGVIPVGGIDETGGLTLSGFSFTYDPTLGNLLVEVVVNNQDNVPNNGANAYNAVMVESGTLSSRAYCLTNFSCFADNTALVTTFSTGPTIPEPGTLMMFGSGLLGLAGVARRKFMR
ncbi:MAG TPA: PEP-CTERM sorting domain-containing protein [Candidatus Eisenbacteria bacterium]|nr:PEP-CTERM sorting domain-containing protein [Candidatus Eisenbacteria bacterium]